MRIGYPVSFHKGIAAALFLLCVVACGSALAQTPQGDMQQQRQQARPTVILPAERAASPAAGETELRCSGFIEYNPSPTRYQVVGSDTEQERRLYTQGDNIFIDAGAQQGITVGQEFSVIRPHGPFRTRLSRKNGVLGIYTLEVGRVRVFEVKERVSVARVVFACETILNGDLLRGVQQRVSPVARPEVELERFADPSGNQTGRIVLARDGREMLSRSQIVFIDLGSEDGVRPGQYLTVFRPSGSGSLTRSYTGEISRQRSDGFQSDRYRGGGFSNQAQRYREPGEEGLFARTHTVDTPSIRRHRPTVPRLVVGEIVILETQQRTATAIITRTAQEVEMGDYVEVQ